MTTIYIIIATIVAWQLVQTIVTIATDENEEIMNVFHYGLWIGVIAIIRLVVTFAITQYQKKYNCYQIFGCPSEKSNYIHSWITNVYMTEEVANKYFIRQFEKDEEVDLDYSVRVLRIGKADPRKTTIPKNDILTEEKILNGVPGLSADFLEKYRK